MNLKLLSAMIFLPLALSSAPAFARNYDCSKAGNANKAVCKGAAAAVKTAPPAAPAKAVASARPSAAAKPAGTAERHYDCSKPGNANKAVCKGAVALAPAPAPIRPAPAAQVRPASLAPTRVAPSSPAPARAVLQSSNSAGATGQCRDGSYTHATQHRGACSRHGGVANWF